MKVLLIKDVYKLGRAGDVKKVADGYGRNFLLPQNMAVLATAGAMKQADRIRQKAAERRTVLNEEMGTVAEQIAKVQLSFGARAGETGKLYGSITSQEIADAIQAKAGVAVKRQQLDMQPLRTLGEHTVRVRLTMDLIPEIKVIVFREGEAEPSLPIEPEAPAPAEAEIAKPAKAKKTKAEEDKPAEAVPAEPAAEAETAKPARAKKAKAEEDKPAEAVPAEPTAEVETAKPARAKKAKTGKDKPDEAEPAEPAAEG